MKGCSKRRKPVANIKSAIKRQRQNIKRRAQNRHYRTSMKNIVKKLYVAIEDKGTSNDALSELMRLTQSTVSHVASKGVIKAKSASRKISRLQADVNARLGA
jgi:small subunit ribosomal protein S20